MNANKFILVVLLFSLQSCIKPSFRGLTSGYKKERSNLDIVFMDTIPNLKDLTKTSIYAVNANTLKEQLQLFDTSLLYFWSPYCSSDSCIPLEVVQRICDEQGVKLFVIANYYDKAIQVEEGVLDLPIFSVDHLFYKSNFVNTYTNRFQKDIVGYKLNDSISYYRYYYFSKDEFVEVQNYIKN